MTALRLRLSAAYLESLALRLCVAAILLGSTVLAWALLVMIAKYGG